LAAVLGAERFLSEIRTTAHLQHPNILPLFDSGEADGQLFYVMPYVDGESLRDRLDREKQLPVDEAVRIAGEVAEALQAAHDDGVIHRDIKPANILLRKGKPLIADFGIALAVSAAGGGRITETGLSLGTPHYMSPEQASADRDPDVRSDLYSLGCVLYEMLIGEPPFSGNTAQAVLAKILTDEPVRPAEQRPAIPANVDAAILKAIEKLPADRFGTGKEFARALADPSFRHGRPAVVAGSSGGPWKAIALGSLAVGGILAIGSLWSILRPEPAGTVEWYSLAPGDAQLNFRTRLTPDGEGMIYSAPNQVGETQLWLRRWDSPSAEPIPGTEGAGDWALSPDGSEIAYVTDGRELAVAPIQGGLSLVVADSVATDLDWTPDGFIYFRGQLRGLERVPAQGGAKETLTQREENRNHYFPDVHPDQDLAIFSVWGDTRWIEAVRLSSGERRRVTDGQKAYLTPSGHLVVGTGDGDLMAARFDPEAMEMSSQLVPISGGVYTQATGLPFFSVSDNGHLLYWPGWYARELELVWVTRSGQASPVEADWTFDPGRDNRNWALSPDGTRIALKMVTDSGDDIRVKELPEGPLRPLTFDSAEERFPRWAPDGQSVTFLSDRAGNFDLWTKRVDGVGEARLLLDREENVNEAFWTTDGEWIVFREGGVGPSFGGRDIFRFRPEVDSVPESLVATEDDETGPALSPNRQWLAYVSTETGRKEVFLTPFSGTEQWKVQVSVDGARGPVWGSSGEELFFVSLGGNALASRDLWVARIDPGTPPTVVERELLFNLPEGFYFANNTTTYSLPTNGEGFLMARAPDTPGDELVLVRNWLELVKDRVGR
jgi:serine/threonine-protein kinase